MASSAFHGSATPSAFASVPQRSQVEGMNCIHPIAPAELGPMFRPKFDSTLLIAARTCHGIPYWVPARRQIALSAFKDTAGDSRRVRYEGGSRSDPVAFGVSALGSAVVDAPTTVNEAISDDGTTRNTGPLAAEPAPVPRSVRRAA